MKTIIKTTFLFFLIAGLFTSCSKKNEPQPDHAKLIVGTWHLDRVENYFQPDGSVQREFVNAQALDQVVKFTADGKFVDDDAVN